MQSIEPNILRNPCVFPICSRWLMLLLFVLLKQSSPNIPFASLTKASKHWITVHSAMLTYSLTLSAGDLYASIRIIAMHFYNGQRPLLPVASNLIWKWIMITKSTIQRNSSFHIRNLHKKKPLCVYRIFKEVVIQQVTMSIFTMAIYMASSLSRSIVILCLLFHLA